MKNIYDCNNILRYLPHLETLEVEGFYMDDELDPPSSQQRSINIIAHRNRLKRLSLRPYQTSRDDEFLHIMAT